MNIRSLLLFLALLSSSNAFSAQMEKIPLEGMYKVSLPGGEVYYLSENRRFVFRGEMYDLWSGQELVADLPLTDVVDFNRNNISTEDMSIKINGADKDAPMIFIAPGCLECVAALRLLIEAKTGFSVVLLAARREQNEVNKWIWCAKDQLMALERVFIEGGEIEKDEIRPNCDPFGLMVAHEAAKLFGIGRLPMLVTENKRGLVGFQPIEAHLKRSVE